jgi:hypothetical protein
VGTGDDRGGGLPGWEEFLNEVDASLRDGPADEVPSRLCDAVLRLLPVTGASLSLLGEESPFVTLCATDEVAARLAEIQYTLGEGPCLAAVRARAPVQSTDLLAGPDSRRWPLFAQQATAAGARSVYSVPLGDAGEVLGTLDLYDRTPGLLGEGALGMAMHAASAVAWALATHHQRHHERSGDTDPDVGWLKKAESSYEEVYKAVGMLMVRLGVGADEAMARLRARAFSEDRSVTEVARAVVGRADDFDAFD